VEAETEVAMGQYLTEARKHAERIEHYYNLPGAPAYQEAKYYLNKLEGLPAKAGRSRRDKPDVKVILEILKKSREQVHEMAIRCDERVRQQEPTGGCEG
jgi:hypothetical protein